MRVIVVIPTWSRSSDYLPRLLESIDFSFFHRLVIVKNPHPRVGCEIEIPERFLGCTTTIRPRRNLGVAGSWNAALSRPHREGMKTESPWDGQWDVAVLLNDDLVLPPGAIEELLTHHRYGLTVNGRGIAFTQEDFSFWAMTFGAWLWVGPFDEKFWPGYYEDKDWIYRAKLIGIEKPASVFISALRHDRSGSIRGSVRDYLAKRNLNYYIEKWGNSPGLENHRIPFDPEGLWDHTPYLVKAVL